MASPAELSAMRRAIELSASAADTTPPNPDVGCVILDRDGHPAGEGWHERPGGPHAEVVALARAGERAHGGTAVVTLEPCDHTGRTGPCTQALVEAGVARVVVAVADPNPVAAGGAATLRAHGVDVELGVLADAAENANARWLAPFRTHRPFVVWKFAATLDGRSAAADGSSRWITGEPARADVHRLRAVVDAVVVGSGTVRADDPQLTARTDPPPARQPLRVVLDSTGRGTPPAARVRDGEAPTWIATVAEVGAAPRTARPGVAEPTTAEPGIAEPATAEPGTARPGTARPGTARPGTARPGIAEPATAEPATAEPGIAEAASRVDLHRLLARLYEQDRRYVLLEGGPTLAGAFWRAGLVDRVVAYLAPALLGAGPAALAEAGIGTIADAIRLDVTDVRMLGADIRITATPREHRKA